MIKRFALIAALLGLASCWDFSGDRNLFCAQRPGVAGCAGDGGSSTDAGGNADAGGGADAGNVDGGADAGTDGGGDGGGCGPCGGCCNPNDGMCVSVTAETNALCGLSGATCTACNAGWACETGVCLVQDAGTDAGCAQGCVLVVGGGPTTAELYDVQTGIWRLATAPLQSSSAAAAFRIGVGMVVVAGGTKAGSVTNDSELYNLNTNSWQTAGQLTTARGVAPVASFGPTGQTKVLLPGGDALAGPTAVTEIFDPSTNAWSGTMAMGTARAAHTATLLQNGKILVAGGESPGPTVLSSAELYDPSQGTWSSANAMGFARENHTATLLNNGDVLVVGGWVQFGTLESTTLRYSGGAWSQVNNPNVQSANHTATLLPGGIVLITGGATGGSIVTNDAELYGLSGNWTGAGNMTQGRQGHSATLLPNGKVLVAGGADSTGASLPSAELYDPSNNTWTPTGSMLSARSQHTATLVP